MASSYHFKIFCTYWCGLKKTKSLVASYMYFKAVVRLFAMFYFYVSISNQHHIGNCIVRINWLFIATRTCAWVTKLFLNMHVHAFYNKVSCNSRLSWSWIPIDQKGQSHRMHYFEYRIKIRYIVCHIKKKLISQCSVVHFQQFWEVNIIIHCNYFFIQENLTLIQATWLKVVYRNWKSGLGFWLI